METIEIDPGCVLEAVCPVFRKDVFDLSFELGNNIVVQGSTLQLVGIAITTDVNL